jgi:hypothetical protein
MKSKPGWRLQRRLLKLGADDQIRTLQRRVLWWRLAALGALILWVFSLRHGHH